MPCRDPYGYALTTSPEAAEAYSRGRAATCCGCASGARRLAGRVDRPRPDLRARPRALALLGHELCAAGRRRRPARATPACTPRAGTERERSHVHAVVRARRAATPRPLVAHLDGVPARRAAALHRRADDRVRRRHRGARGGVGDRRARGRRRTATTGGSPGCWRSCARSRAASTRRWTCPAARWPWSPAPATRRTPGRTRTTRPATTHAGWPGWTRWVTGDGASTDSLSHFSWHAALHELSLGDLDAVRRRYDASSAPSTGSAAGRSSTPARCCSAGR